MRVSYGMVFYDAGDRDDKKQTGFVLRNAFTRFLIQLIDLKAIVFIDDNGQVRNLTDDEKKILEEGIRKLCGISE